jgi:hypothetical protein
VQLESGFDDFGTRGGLKYNPTEATVSPSEQTEMATNRSPQPMRKNSFKMDSQDNPELESP